MPPDQPPPTPSPGELNPGPARWNGAPLRGAQRGTRPVLALRAAAAAAVFGLGATAAATLVVAIAKTVKLIVDLAGGTWRQDLAMVSVLQAVDTYLLAIVQLIVAIGIYELFIADLDVPEWLEARSLDDLKKPIIDVLVVFVAIAGIQRLLVAERPADALTAVGAASMLVVALTAFRAFTGLGAGRRRTGAAAPDRAVVAAVAGDPHPVPHRAGAAS